MRKFGFLLLLLHLTSCGDRSSRTALNTDGRAIIGASRTDLEDPVAKFTVQVIDPSGSCTGVLVGHDVVLTAAHCISNQKVYVLFKSKALSVRVAVAKRECSSSQKAILGKYREIDRLHEKVLKRNLEIADLEAHDLADICKLRLVRNAPASHSPIRLWNGVTIASNAVIRYSGWGRSSDGRNDFGHLRYAEARVTGVSQRFVMSDSGSGRAKPCFGDSGGPAFIFNEKGEPELLGILSLMAGDFGAGDSCRIYHFQFVTRATVLLNDLARI